MANRTTTRYVLADPREVEIDGEYVDAQPVLKQIVVRDGQLTFVKQEKIMANSLSEFRETYPDIHVVGVPSYQELSRVAKELSDEELAEMGLARAGSAADTNEDLFASDAAQELAADFQLNPGVLRDLEGSGKDGRLTTNDIRSFVEAE
jgi:hypothetical protein